MTDPLTSMRTDWLAVTTGTTADQFTVLEDLTQLPNGPFFQSPHWNKMFFQDGLGPYTEREENRHLFHLATGDSWDLLRHEFVAKDLPVVVTESTIAVHIAFPAFPETSFGGADPLQQAAALASAFLDLETPPAFSSIDGDPTPGTFTSAPGIGLTQLVTWTDRIDGVKLDEGLALVCYKAHPETQQYIPATQWFSAEFRAANGS